MNADSINQSAPVPEGKGMNLPMLATLFSLLFILASGGCLDDRALDNKHECVQSDDCNANRVCVGGQCLRAEEVPDEGAKDAGASPLKSPTACAMPHGPVEPMSTRAQLLATLVGRWFLCDGPGIHTYNTADQVGIELVEDGKFYLLRPNAGAVVRGTGFYYEGTWDVLSQEPPFELNLHFSDGHTGFHPAFENNPRKMLANPYPGTNPSTYAPY